MTQELEVKAAPSSRIEVFDPIPLLSTGHFEQMQRLATLLAESTLIPESLRMTAAIGDNGWPIKQNGKNVMVDLPHRTIIANCFLVVEQAVRWGLSPFGVAQSVSVVHGRLCYEGKLVAGVLDAKLGIELDYEWGTGTGDAYGIIVSGRTQKRGELKTVSGTVGDWKTTGAQSPWDKVANHHRMLAYRGAREWARLFKPSLMLGVYTPDEMSALEERPRAVAPVQHALGRPQMAADDGPYFAGKHEVEPTHLPELNGGTAPSEEAGPVDENPTLPSATTSGASSTQETDTSQPKPSELPSTSTMASTEPSGGTGSAPQQDSPPETTAVPERTDEILPEPTRPEDYEAFWIKCLAVAEDRKDASAEWAGQRALRTRLAVDMDTVARCKAMVDRDFPKEG